MGSQAIGVARSCAKFSATPFTIGSMLARTASDWRIASSDFSIERSCGSIHKHRPAAERAIGTPDGLWASTPLPGLDGATLDARFLSTRYSYDAHDARVPFSALRDNRSDRFSAMRNRK